MASGAWGDRWGDTWGDRWGAAEAPAEEEVVAPAVAPIQTGGPGGGGGPSWDRLTLVDDHKRASKHYIYADTRVFCLQITPDGDYSARSKVRESYQDQAALRGEVSGRSTVEFRRVIRHHEPELGIIEVSLQLQSSTESYLKDIAKVKAEDDAFFMLRSLYQK